MNEKSAKDKTISTQYGELNKFSQNEDFERALKAANKILGVAPHEYLAFHCKIVCLIQLGRFEEAIGHVNKNPEHLQTLIFEKAYCYYRLNKHQEALETIAKCESEPDFRTKELQAQIFYRLEQYKEAHAIYQNIIKNTDDDYEEERLTNLYATMVFLDENERADFEELRETPYELCYNKACMLIASENYLEAEKKLKQCEKLCRDKLEEDDMNEEDVEIELALIRIQLAYVYQKQQRIKEAQALYTSTLKLKLQDAAAQAVACNNVVAINKDQNLFDSKKKMKIALNDTLVHKLPTLQRKYIALNNAILNYYINQADQCEKACKVLESQWPEFSNQILILRSLNLIKANKINEAIKLLIDHKNGRQASSEVYVDLCLAQFYLIKGDKMEACRVLENLADDGAFRPGIVGALTTLYLALGDERAALAVFEKTVEFYKKKKVKSADLSSFWRQAADFHIRNGHPQVAANSLEELLSVNKDDKKITAQLTLACAQFDKGRALKLAKQLPTIKELSKDVDLENIQLLTAVNFKKSPSAVGKSDSSLPNTPRTDEKKKKKHQHRKGKLPKNYDASVQPDPERWLPKYERAGYRKKRDRRSAKDVIKGSQGTSSGQSEQYDFSSKKVDEIGFDSVTEPSPRGKQQKKGAGQQKKKNNKRR